MSMENSKDPDFKSNRPAFGDYQAPNDKDYIDFIGKAGDGFYYDKSLHIYGLSDKPYHDLTARNSLIKSKYHWLKGIEEIFVFGEDLFGNQFVFYNEGIGFFMIETGNIEFISADFKNWISTIEAETDYYTGRQFSGILTDLEAGLAYDERVAAKLPFVAGGEYELKNMYKAYFQDVIQFNADLAQQIHDMPDGTEIKFEFE